MSKRKLLKCRNYNELMSEFELYKGEYKQVGSIKMYFNDAYPYQMLIEKVDNND